MRKAIEPERAHTSTQVLAVGAAKMVGQDSDPAALPRAGPVGRRAPIADLGGQGCRLLPGRISAAVDAFQQAVPNEPRDRHADGGRLDAEQGASTCQVGQRLRPAPAYAHQRQDKGARGYVFGGDGFKT